MRGGVVVARDAVLAGADHHPVAHHDRPERTPAVGDVGGRERDGLRQPALVVGGHGAPTDRVQASPASGAPSRTTTASISPYGPVGREEDLTGVLQPERAQVREEVVLVRCREPDLDHLGDGVEDRLAHLPQRLLQGEGVPGGEGGEHDLADPRVGGVEVDVGRPRSATGPRATSPAPGRDVSGRVVYSSVRKPRNSEPVDFSTVRSLSPAITVVPSASAVTDAVRTSCPLRTHVWSCSTPSTRTRTHAYSWTSTRAPVTGSTSSTKCRASRVANASGEDDAVLLGVRERHVLLGVRGQHRRLVAVEVGGREVPAQGRRDVEVPDLVARRVAHDPDHARLGLAVLVGVQSGRHGRSVPG